MSDGASKFPLDRWRGEGCGAAGLRTGERDILFLLEFAARGEAGAGTAVRASVLAFFEFDECGSLVSVSRAGGGSGDD